MTTFNKEEFIKKSFYDEYLKEISLVDDIQKEGFIYIRVSTEDQVENSPYSQLKEILEFCIDKKILIKKENIYVDGGISGTRADNRIEFQRMINCACDKKSPCKCVLVHKYDRFARNKEESVLFKSKLKKFGVNVISIKEPLPEDRKTALILESNLEMNSELYSINLSDEVYKGLRINAEAGKVQTRACYGYKKVFDHIEKYKNKDKIVRRMEIDEVEATTVRKIFQDFINGSSAYFIARKLNDLGLKTRDGCIWDDNRVRYILNNITYNGYSHWTEQGKETTVCKGNFPVIIDDETWNKAQTIIKSKSAIKINYGTKKEHWLRGKVRCSNCDSYLVINNNSFQCCGYTHGSCKESHSIKIEKLESIVLEYFEHLTPNDIVNININNIRLQNNDELTIAINNLEQINNKIKRIIVAYENEVYTLEEFSERKNILETDKKVLCKKINELKKEPDFRGIQDKLYKKCDNVKNILKDDKVPILDKMFLLNEILEKIVFDKKNMSFTFYFRAI